MSDIFFSTCRRPKSARSNGSRKRKTTVAEIISCSFLNFATLTTTRKAPCTFRTRPIATMPGFPKNDKEPQPGPIALQSRRYIGSKGKLADWIIETIKRECPEARTFCDLFAGTGIVAAKAIGLYDEVTVNDILYANNIIYKAFFAAGEWSRDKLVALTDRYNGTDAAALPDNYFSTNFGGKYFALNASKLIGFIRQDIEDHREELTEKEYDILLATLIYNIDRKANTLGHFEAYIKGRDIPDKPLQLRLIDAHSYGNVEIFREDGNTLARSLRADVVYIDPPYNSRQYNSAYHLYENLVRWEKPEVHGVACKFTQNGGRSEYCTAKAAGAFADLVKNLRTRYIVLSYNNMGNKGDGRSNAKISDNEILEILGSKGEVRIFSQEHKPFSAGKSDIQNNRERLFVCTCRN